MRNFEDPVKRKECTDKSIEARKDGKAAMKQAITNGIKSSFWETNAKTKYQNKRLKEPIYNYLIEQIFGNDGKWVKDYIDGQLKEARKDPNSRAAERIASGLFNEALWNELDVYLQQANKEDADYTKYLIRQSLYDRQREVFDNDIDKTILIINSRRSGKTHLMGHLIAKGLLVPDAHIVYINRNSSAAIRQIKGPLETALKSTNGRINMVKGSVEAQEVHFNTGGQLLIVGNNNSADIDKMRGERISLCIMDECAHQRNTRQLIREVIGPALKDYADSQLVMVGTPPRIPHTYVEELWDSNRVKKYHWTFEENPHIPNRDLVIKQVCEENGCTPDSAFIQREYFGRMDAFDDDAKWIKRYSYSPSKQIPKIVDYAYVGVDFGFEDKPAVVSIVCANNRAYIVDVWSENHHGVVDISNEIKRQYEKLKEDYVVTKNVKVICDTNVKEAVWDLYSVYKIPNVFTAYKANKDLGMDQLNDFFSSNKITISDALQKDNPVEEDIKSAVWKRDEETDKLLHELDDDLYHPNALMAVLYVSRCYANEVLNLIDYNKMAKNITEAVKSEAVKNE